MYWYPATNLTITDGIIGQVLAKKEFRKMTETLYDDYRETIEALPPSSQREYVQDLVLDAETVAELKWDPIAILASKLEYEAYEKGIVKGYRAEYLNDPALPDGNLYDASVVQKRVEMVKNAVRVGCRITAKTSGNPVVETVWLRNFENAMVSALHIASNIAELLAFKRALDSSASLKATW